MRHSIPIPNRYPTTCAGRSTRLVVIDVPSPDLTILKGDVVVSYFGVRLYAEDAGVHVREVGDVQKVLYSPRR